MVALSTPVKHHRLPTLADLGDVAGKNVLLRADFNVPLDDEGNITDDLRIMAGLPTIEWLTSRGARLTICTHLGRPDGIPDFRYSLDPVRARLAVLTPGVELLHNLRFDPGEVNNDPAFVRRLVDGHDLYVNDAFGVSHRAHASIVGPPKFLPSAAGMLLEEEVEVLRRLRDDPPRPFVAVLGGAKVFDKLGVLRALVDVVDELVIGGAMCFTFLAAQGHSVGESFVEVDQIDACRALLNRSTNIHLPSDLTVLNAEGQLFNPAAGGQVRHVGVNVPDGWMGVDIGPGTAAEFSEVIHEARTVFWNGPMGAFEDPRFAAGTRTVAEAVVETRAFTVVGGGDSAAALVAFDLQDGVDHVSTGGGASLELLENGDLPGLAALRGAPNAPLAPAAAAGALS